MLKRLRSLCRCIRFPRIPVGDFVRAHREPLQRWGLRAGALGALALVVILVHRTVYSFVSGQRTFGVRNAPAAVDLTPNWGDPRGGEGVVMLALGEASLLDDGLVERVARAFGANPWVKKVASVERVYPDHLRVRVEFRRPHLAVQRPNGFVVIDAEGVRLPGVYAEPPACDVSVRVTGTSSQPPAPGRAWAEPEIAAAIEMASLVGDPVLARAKVAAIDVSNVNGRVDRRRAEIALVTAGGCAIEWGRAPSTRRHGEIALADKLDNLRRVLETYPNLEGRARVKLHVTPRGQLAPTVPAESGLGKPRK
jgi:hypothetical protein